MKCLKCNKIWLTAIGLKKLTCNCSQEYVWSEQSDNPESMTILDPQTNTTYTQAEAEQAPKEIKNRLTNHYTKKGYWVTKI